MHQGGCLGTNARGCFLHHSMSSALSSVVRWSWTVCAAWYDQRGRLTLGAAANAGRGSASASTAVGLESATGQLRPMSSACGGA
jgi:hypothetical protein